MEIKSNYSIFDYTNLLYAGMDQQSQNALGNGIKFYQNGDYKRAVQEFQRSIALSPFNENVIDTYNYMANSFLKLDDIRGAENAYKTALSVDPQREDVYLNLGNLYYSQEKFVQAQQAYKNAVRVYPSSETYYSLAHCSLEMEKLDEAERLFQKVIRMEPKSENGYYGLGMTYAKQGEHEKAIEQFQKGGRDELVQKEQAELEVLQSYLPQQMSEDEIRALVKEAIEAVEAASMKDIGKVIKYIMPNTQGRADGKIINQKNGLSSTNAQEERREKREGAA